jgi:hypothetical protein
MMTTKRDIYYGTKEYYEELPARKDFMDLFTKFVRTLPFIEESDLIKESPSHRMTAKNLTDLINIIRPVTHVTAGLRTKGITDIMSFINSHTKLINKIWATFLDMLRRKDVMATPVRDAFQMGPYNSPGNVTWELIGFMRGSNILSFPVNMMLKGTFENLTKDHKLDPSGYVSDSVSSLPQMQRDTNIYSLLQDLINK